MRRWFLAAALATTTLGTTALVYSDDAKKPAMADSELAKAKAKYDADVKGKEDEIRKAVRKTRLIVVCLSSNAVNKEGYIQKEIRAALETRGSQARRQDLYRSCEARAL